MLARALAVVCLAAFAGGAAAQVPEPQQPPDPLVMRLASEWAALQLANQHVAESLAKLLEERRELQKQLAAERARGAKPETK